LGSPNVSDDEPNEGNMILAVRAPPGSTLEIPSETQIKEMHTLALKNKDLMHN
jgi:hypothetical protein